MIDLPHVDFHVRRLHGRYADAVWRKDDAAFAALFAPDAEWKIAGMCLRGSDEIGATFARFMTHVERTLMMFGDPVVDLDGAGTPISRTYVTENNRFADGRTASTIGTYYEWFEPADGDWTFRRRHWDLHYIGEPDFSGSLYPVRDYGPAPAMPGPAEPTTIRTDFLFGATAAP